MQLQEIIFQNPIAILLEIAPIMMWISVSSNLGATFEKKTHATFLHAACWNFILILHTEEITIHF